MTDSAERRIAGVAAPPELFNFAEHLFTTNAGRPGKAAFVDDFATLG